MDSNTFDFKPYKPNIMADFKCGDKIYLPPESYKYLLGMMRLPSDTDKIDVDGIVFMQNKDLTDKAVSI